MKFMLWVVGFCMLLGMSQQFCGFLLMLGMLFADEIEREYKRFDRDRERGP